MAKPARKNSSYDKFRGPELAKIHIGKKDLGLDDDTYRDILREAGRVESSADLDYRGRMAVLERFKELGWRPKCRARAPGTGDRGKRLSRPLADDPQSKKIRALWLDLHAAGKVRDSSERALASYCKRMTGRDALQWLSTGEASRVIEALKQWLER
jgi:phage gp16-like protein